jgi:hypothetical protein
LYKFSCFCSAAQIRHKKHLVFAEFSFFLQNFSDAHLAYGYESKHHLCSTEHNNAILIDKQNVESNYSNRGLFDNERA